MITTSAPGKLMLFGEHAVLYGQPCIVTAVSKRLSVSVEQTDQKGITFDTPQVADTRFINAAIAAALQQWQLAGDGFHLITNCSFAEINGFGSSSAVVVATIAALSLLLEKPLSQKQLFDLSFSAVTSVQGVGSGFDVAAAVYGGTLFFKNQGESILPITLPPGDAVWITAYSGIKANTAAVIAEVREKREQYPEKVDRIFHAIGELVAQAQQKFLEGDWERVGTLMNYNQEYLRDLGVSSEQLESILAAANTSGAWGAKLSGAGKGDCIIAIVAKERASQVVQAIAKAGGTVIPVELNALGVHQETDDQSELFVVVDQDDRVIDYRTRWDCHHDRSLIHRTVGVVISNKNGDILLQKRSDTKDSYPGYWAISAAGHVTKGQTDDQAVEREMKEELGIAVPLTFVNKFIYRDEIETERAALYRGIYDGPFHPDPKEVSEVQFFSPETIRQGIEKHTLQLSSGGLESLKKIGIL